MYELFLSLVPLAIAAALQPPQVIALFILLQTRRGLANGLAYILGMIAFRLILGGSFWVLISNVEETIETKGGNFSILVGTVFLVLAILMLVYALRRGLSAHDEDEAAASWLGKLDDVSPLRVALLGAAFLALDPKDWLVDISAINLIANADLSGPDSLLAFLAYILLAQLLLLIPLILSFAFPQRAKSVLAAFTAWMERQQRAIEIVFALIFGLLFLYTGLDLLGVWS
jgi:threonine/homoserine/homoserine lactone efflux protein